MRKLIDIRLAGMVFAVAAAFSTQACGEDGTPGIPGGDELAKECGLTCSTEGIAEGNFAISGVRGVDAFFAAVVNFNTRATVISGNIDAELGKIYASVGATGAADFKAKLIAEFNLDAEAGVKIAYKPAKCAVSAKATLEAAARCDASVDPGSAKVTCKGSCEADVSVKAECEGSAMATCTGTAPSFQCMGECSGSCELEVAAECSGTCRGTCSGTCSVENADGSCAGECQGTCQGTCELAAGGQCEGKCTGECTYMPPDGKCEAGAQLRCEAMGNASVECEGRCEGEVEPPMVKAECQATAKAEAELNVECTPPSVDVVYQLDASLTGAARADAQVKFDAFLSNFRVSMGRILAEIEGAGVVIEAGGDIVAAADGALKDAFETVGAEGSLKAKIGVACAVTELGNVGGVIQGATSKLQASVTAAGELTTELGG